MAQFTAVLRTFTASARQLVAVPAAIALLMAGVLGDSRSFAQDPSAVPAAAAAPAALSLEKLDQLLAPIALYPDNLLGQILAAATYPLDVVVAARWAAANPNLTGQALEDAMQQQNWDPSVKALTTVPQVLQMMSEKVEWTRELGEAYLVQPDDIAASVQRLRARADASGNLKETSKLKVKRVKAPPPEPDVVYVAPPPPEYIVIEPYEPDVIFVPVYDPFVVYGVWPYPYYRPWYWYPPGYVRIGIIGYGAPCIVGAAIYANYHWHSRRVVINVNNYNKARFNHVKLASTSANQNWSHDPKRRGNLSYNSPQLQKQYGKPGPSTIKQGSTFAPGTSRQSLSTQGATSTTNKLPTTTDKKLPTTTDKKFAPTDKKFTTNQGKPVAALNNNTSNLNRSAKVNPGGSNVQRSLNPNKPVTTNRTGMSGNRQLVGGQNTQFRQNTNVRPNVSARPNVAARPNTNAKGYKPY